MGVCLEVALTAFACYAQAVEGLPCDDELYVCRPADKEFLEAYNANP